MNNTSSKKSLLWVAVALTLVYIGVQLYLNKHHIDLKLGIGNSQSLCNVSEKLNCDTAATSSYAELFGVPMALLGAFTAGLLLVFSLLAAWKMTADTERTERYAFYVSSFMLLVSLVMGAISLFILKSGCPFCIASYILSILIWLCLLGAFRPKVSYFVDDVRDALTTEKWVLGVAISVPLLAFLVNNMVLDSYGYQEIKRVTEDSLNSWKSAPAQTFDASSGLSFQNGSEPAKVTLVEFADFLCPHCRAAMPNLHTFTKTHPDVKLIFKSFPLDGTCNAAIPHKGDGKRCEYAYATFCAESVSKKGWDALNYFFDHQETLFASAPEKIVEDFCKASGTDCAPIKTCMTGDEVHEQVRKMAAEGEKAQIGGTPTIFFNDKVLAGGQIPSILENTYRNFAK